MLKYWRLWLLLVVVLGSVFAIGFTNKRYGVEVIYVTKDSPAFGVLEQGATITQVNGQQITDTDEWDSAISGISGDVSIVADNQNYVFFVNGTLGIETQPVQRLNLDFGLDLRGGTRIILKPKENATKSTI